jgi:hypothetical protein
LALDANQIRGAGAAALAQGLSSSTSALAILKLAENKIGLVGAQAFGDALSQNRGLALVVMTGCNLGDDGAAALAAGLGNNPTLRALTLNNNVIGPAGAAALANGIAVFSGNTYHGEAVHDENHENRKTSEEQWRGGSRLEALHLDKNEIGDKGIHAIATVLQTHADTVTLQDLAVQSNGITTRGATALGKVLRTNTRITRIDLAGLNNVDEVIIDAIKTAIDRNAHQPRGSDREGGGGDRDGGDHNAAGDQRRNNAGIEPPAKAESSSHTGKKRNSRPATKRNKSPDMPPRLPSSTPVPLSLSAPPPPVVTLGKDGFRQVCNDAGLAFTEIRRVTSFNYGTMYDKKGPAAVPVVIAGAGRGLPAVDKWKTPGYLRHAFNNSKTEPPLTRFTTAACVIVVLCVDGSLQHHLVSVGRGYDGSSTHKHARTHARIAATTRVNLPTLNRSQQFQFQP